MVAKKWKAVSGGEWPVGSASERVIAASPVATRKDALWSLVVDCRVVCREHADDGSTMLHT